MISAISSISTMKILTVTDITDILKLWEFVAEIFGFSLEDFTTDSSCLPWEIAKTVTNWAAIFGGIVLLGFLIYGGYQYMVSAGDPGKLEQAVKTIVNALIGFAILILAWTITGLVMWLFGVSNDCWVRGMPHDDDSCYEDCINTDPNNSGGYVGDDGKCICY